MKYIIMIVAAYAAMTVGMNVAHANTPLPYRYDFFNTSILTEKDTIPACIVVDRNNDKLVTPYNCTKAIKIFAETIRKKDPAAILDFALDGMELSKS